MIDAYNSHSYSFDENDVRKLEQLDAILGFNNNHQAVRHHKVNQPQNLTANEAALRDALVDKMKKMVWMSSLMPMKPIRYIKKLLMK